MSKSLSLYDKNTIKRNLNKCLDGIKSNDVTDILNNSFACFQKEMGTWNVNPIYNQGLIEVTDVNTDLAILGTGMFMVRDDQHPDKILLTRAGSFRVGPDQTLSNAAGYKLLGYKLDYKNNPSNQLEPINIKKIPILGAQSATTEVSLSMNLRKSERIVPSEGPKLKTPLSSQNNSSIGSHDLIVPENSSNIKLNKGDSITFTSSNNKSYEFVYGGFTEGKDISKNIMGASNITDIFKEQISYGDSFTIKTNYYNYLHNQTCTFTFNPTTPNSSAGEFNNLVTLNNAINYCFTLSARISDNKLYVSPIDARQPLNFQDIKGSIVKNLGLTDTEASPNHFSNLRGLGLLIEDTHDLYSAIENPLKNSALNVYNIDPLKPWSVKGNPDTLAAFGLDRVSQIDYDPSYDPNGKVAANIASGMVTPQFSRDVRIFDSFGSGYDFRVSFLKTALNTWAAEFYAVDPDSILNASKDGQVTNGVIEFNGDGTLKSVSHSLAKPVKINWADGALPSEITFNWGTAGSVAGTHTLGPIGKTDGMMQLEGDYSVLFADQNGVSPRILKSIYVNSEGILIADYRDGITKGAFHIPLAKVPYPEGLKFYDGDAYEYNKELTGEIIISNLDNPTSLSMFGDILPGHLETFN